MQLLIVEFCRLWWLDFFQPGQFPNIQQYVMVVLHNIHIYIHTYIVSFPLPSVDNQSLQNNFSSSSIMRSQPRLPDSSHLFGRCPTSNCSDRSQWGIASNSAAAVKLRFLWCRLRGKNSARQETRFILIGANISIWWCRCTLVLQNQSFKLCNFT